MDRWIALLRGVNVGGKGKLSMSRLANEFTTIGFTQIRTYLQSGNVVFCARAKTRSVVAKKISDRLALSFGFHPQVLVKSRAEFQQIVVANPFPEIDPTSTALHCFFLFAAARRPDRAGLDARKSPSERWVLLPDVLYLHAPEGFGRSKLAAAAERLIGVPLTARNWRTVTTLNALAHESE
jgi:uncharacterized protein (DUF1697 family)